ncbi:hypothetical protein HYN59_03745 [Flavobacterium album]|uniref:Bax inhibitor-1/YccA family protein n=2 Tax=Flavobacterium album TaxID=2175091 RepID=A0A2S1QVM8_9FLAO|nr:hypothetical protein HYN59_03745 [Flavobacterium album]
MKSSNPFLKNKSFSPTTNVYGANTYQEVIDYNNTMTVNGAINKSFLLLVLLLGGAASTWVMAYNGMNPFGLMITGAIAGFIVVLIAAFKPKYSPYLAPAYAVLEGLFIGGLSAFIEVMYPGVAIQAVGATFVTFIVCFALYRFKVVKVTEQFKSIAIAATAAIATFYLISWIVWMFTGSYLIGHSFRDNSLMSIGISVFVIVIAAINLFLDFDMIEQGAQRKLPKYMEWFGAMGLMVTLVWLYIEFLKLFAKIAGRD